MVLQNGPSIEEGYPKATQPTGFPRASTNVRQLRARGISKKDLNVLLFSRLLGSLSKDSTRFGPHTKP